MFKYMAHEEISTSPILISPTSDTPKVNLINLKTNPNLGTLKFNDLSKRDIHPNLNASEFNNLPKNASSKNSSNNLLYKLQELLSEDLAWETLIVKQFILIYWVKLTIQEKEGNFITTRDIYEKYKKNCNSVNDKVILTKASFYRLIWNSLLTAKIMYVKSQENGKKGIRGIQFKKIENN